VYRHTDRAVNLLSKLRAKTGISLKSSDMLPKMTYPVFSNPFVNADDILLQRGLEVL
jgi:hypothetical protein